MFLPGDLITPTTQLSAYKVEGRNRFTPSSLYSGEPVMYLGEQTSIVADVDWSYYVALLVKEDVMIVARHTLLYFSRVVPL